MKKLILLIVILQNLFALGEINPIPLDQEVLVSKVMKVLNLPSNKTAKDIVYGKMSSFFTSNWSAHWTTNAVDTNTKIENSPTQVCDVSIFNDNRVANCTFVYFKEEKQLFITIKQYIGAESNLVLEIYRKRKEDSAYTLEKETDSYAYFKEKDFISYEAHHVKTPVGMVIYESSYIFDIE